MNVAVIGAGPAGLSLASSLGRSNYRVTVFDHRVPWEKPCGGGLTPKVFREYPGLRGLTGEWHEARELRFMLSSGSMVELKIGKPMLTISRRTLGKAMLEQALESGAEFIPEKVTDIKPVKEGYLVKTGCREIPFDFIAGADGSNGISRKKLSQAFVREDMCLAFNSFLPFEAKVPVTIKFYPDMIGYSWLFPRKGHASIGIAAKPPMPRAGEMKHRLRTFAEHALRDTGIRLPDALPLKAARIPSLSTESMAANRVAGPGWALIGDASGIVDPITGEGLYYALKTADILFESIKFDNAKSYPARLRDFAAQSLHHAPSWCYKFYRPDIQKIWGRLFERSSHTRAIIADIIQGDQDYASLKPRLLKALPKASIQSIISS